MGEVTRKVLPFVHVMLESPEPCCNQRLEQNSLATTFVIETLPSSRSSLFSMGVRQWIHTYIYIYIYKYIYIISYWNRWHQYWNTDIIHTLVPESIVYTISKIFVYVLSWKRNQESLQWRNFNGEYLIIRLVVEKF